MAWAGLNKRQFPRVNARLDIAIGGRSHEPIRAQTQNVGVGGVCVMLKEELEKLSSVSLKLRLKEETPPIECEGRVVWNVRSKEPATGQVTFDTGIEFIGLKPADHDKVLHFIEKRV